MQRSWCRGGAEVLRRFTRDDCAGAKKQGSTKEEQRCRVEQSRAAPGAEQVQMKCRRVVQKCWWCRGDCDCAGDAEQVQRYRGAGAEWVQKWCTGGADMQV